MQSRPKFLLQEAPVNYVAGLGRGAVGFTTRSDIGPARTAPDAAGRGRGRGAAPPGLGGDAEARPTTGRDEDDDGLFFNAQHYDQEDEEADDIFAAVDRRMDSRRRVQREARAKLEQEEFERQQPNIKAQFADLRGELSKVSYADWEGLADIGDYTVKKQKRQVEINAPETLLERARRESEHLTSVEQGTDTPMTDLNVLGEAQRSVLGVKLDRMSDSVTGQTAVEPQGYLTSLSSRKISSDAELGDIKKAQLLLRSVRKSNPKHAPAWIASARLEEIAGKLTTARSVINQGCQECPLSEDVWLEAIRLQPPAQAKAVVTQAVQSIPHSVKLWVKACNLETALKSKKRVLRRALQLIPNSVRLWKAAVELEEPEDARILLTQAVKCVPDSVDMWLALAHLETFERARQVLNEAAQHLPTESALWIAAAKLEEAHGNQRMCDKLIRRSIQGMEALGVTVDREAWLRSAEDCERAGSTGTCRAIIGAVVGHGIEDVDRESTWTDDAQHSLQRGMVETARAIFAHALAVFPQKKSLWREAARLEKEHGTRESLAELLAEAVEKCPHAEVLWLMAAKEKWLGGDVDGARAVLDRAFSHNDNSEAIWLAAAKLEFENAQPERARMLLQEARKRAPTGRVFMKSALLERQMQQSDAERALLEQGLEAFPKSPKLWLMLGQHWDRAGSHDKAMDAYRRGLQACPRETQLWLGAARQEAKASPIRARTLLEKARLQNPGNADIWLAAIRLEKDAGLQKAAEMLLAKALAECPKSGVLRAESIVMAPRPQKRSRIVDAIKACENDKYVAVQVGRLFWADRKLDKARSWLNRAVVIDGKYGDGWAVYLRMLEQHGTPEERAALIKRCEAAEPLYGEIWQRVAKADENRGLSVRQVLERVAKEVKM